MEIEQDLFLVSAYQKQKRDTQINNLYSSQESKRIQLTQILDDTESRKTFISDQCFMFF